MSPARMDLRTAFGLILRLAREKKGLSQEAFGDVSSRTYVSAIERGLKNPTLDKIDQLSSQMGVHPLTLILATFAKRDGTALDELMLRAKKEVSALLRSDSN